MNVGIFETEHFEGSYPVIKLFDDGKNDLTIFTYEPAYEQFKHLFPGEPAKYDWVVKPGNRSKPGFILDMYRLIKKKKITLLYLNTISNNFIFYAILVLLLPKVRVILTIHNVNTQFEFKSALSLRRVIRYIGRRRLISAVREFNVVAMPMVSYLGAKLPSHKKVFCVPGAVFEPEKCRQQQPAVTHHVNIVIPGSVDGRRRDYQQAFSLVQKLENSKLASTIIFLGSFYDTYGTQILERARTIQTNYAKLKYFGFDTVAQPEFDRHMNEATFVFIPSVLTTVIEDGVKEIYGTTISSGNLFDIIKHAKPFIIPAGLKVDPFLENSCFRYQNPDEIVEFILSLQTNPDKYALLQRAALNASLNYSVQKVRERNGGLFAG